MRYIRPIYLFPLLLAAVLSGCGVARKSSGIKFRDTATLVPDSSGMVAVRGSLFLPENAVSKRSRLVATPVMLEGDRVVGRYEPLVFDARIFAKKMERRKTLERYVDSLDAYVRHIRTRESYDIGYERSFSADGVPAGRLAFVLQAEGCGRCALLDTLEAAALTDYRELMIPSFDLSPRQSAFRVVPKERTGQGSATFHFVINRYDINLSFARNREEMERMLAELQAVVNDPLATLDSVSIYGMASADGPYDFNTRLSLNRARSAKSWLEKKLMLDGNAPRPVFSVGSKPEGWQPVLDALSADSRPEADTVRAILERFRTENDDVAERYIRALPVWPLIRAKYLKKDRKVDYVYRYRIRNFLTDREMMQMFYERPDAMNEEEFLRVAGLMTTDEDLEIVYRATLLHLPESETAAFNLGVLLLRQGEAEEAARVLERYGRGRVPLVWLQAVACYRMGRYAEAETLLRPYPDCAEARYLRGMALAAERRYDGAYDCLKDFDDANAALVALSLGKEKEAEKILSRCADTDSRTAYVRALVAARNGNKDQVLENLEVALRDERYRSRARTEADFRTYIDWDQFSRLLEEVNDGR